VDDIELESEADIDAVTADMYHPEDPSDPEVLKDEVGGVVSPTPLPPLPACTLSK
jgi:hypothetical protein